MSQESQGEIVSCIPKPLDFWDQPATWVTNQTGDIGNTFGRVGANQPSVDGTKKVQSRGASTLTQVARTSMLSGKRRFDHGIAHVLARRGSRAGFGEAALTIEPALTFVEARKQDRSVVERPRAVVN